MQKQVFGYLIFIAVTFGSQTAFAVSEHAHIPWNELIIPQIINLAILAGALGFALKGPVRNYFSGRAETFEAAKADAAKAKRIAEAAHDDVKQRLANLESTAKASLQTATQEAAQLKVKIIEDAKQLALRFDQEAHRTAQHELQKATLNLRAERVGKSLEIAEAEIQEQLDTKTQQQLQAAFVSRAQGVRL